MDLSSLLKLTHPYEVVSSLFSLVVFGLVAVIIGWLKLIVIVLGLRRAGQKFSKHLLEGWRQFKMSRGEFDEKGDLTKMVNLAKMFHGFGK